MSESLDGYTIGAALRNPEDMRRLLFAVNRNIVSMRERLGLDTEFADDPALTAEVKAPPPLASWNVTGIDGQFEIDITLPQDATPLSITLLQASITKDTNKLRAAMVHEIQYATDVLFNAASKVRTLGPTPDLKITFQDPNKTYFFRIHSSYDGSNFNDWQVFQSPALCGPVGVSSGYARSTSLAPNASLNTSNNCTVDSIDNGVNATIRVYGPGGVGTAWSHFDGQGGETVLPYSTVTAAYSTDMIVLYSVAAGLSAFPTASQYTNALQDGLLFSGKSHTVAAGGGGGTSGGGGGSEGGGGGGRGLVS